MNIPCDLVDLESGELTTRDLQDCLKQFRYFPHLVEWLLGPAHDGTVLRKLIENTHAVVQRERPMGWRKQLSREDGAKGVRPEDRWERTMWRKWRPFKGNMPVTVFHALAPMILSYQLPLYGKQESEGWGKIDLVGISGEYLPVVIEVKAEYSAESPLAVVLEAVRYGIALREMWERGLRDDWTGALQDVGIVGQPLPRRLEQCQLICAAPWEYWKRLGPMTSNDEQNRGAWIALREICAKLAADHGLPVEFVQLEFSAKTLSTGR